MNAAFNRIWAVATVVLREMVRRKDFYVLFILTVLITLLMASVTVFNDPRIARYLKEVCLLLIWLSSLVIAITTAARQIPAEKESRTIFPLLAKPLTRGQFILGKFLGCWLACGLALLCFYVFFGVLSASREEHWHVLNWLQAVALHWLALGVVTAFTLLGSLVFAAPSSNGTIVFVVTAGLLFFGRHLNKVALGLAEPLHSLVYGLYFALPHLEWFDVRDLVIHNQPPIEWGVWLFAVVYALAWMAFALALACAKFRRAALN